jgi:hypothetical protein
MQSSDRRSPRLSVFPSLRSRSSKSLRSPLRRNLSARRVGVSHNSRLARKWRTPFTGE